MGVRASQLQQQQPNPFQSPYMFHQQQAEREQKNLDFHLRQRLKKIFRKRSFTASRITEFARGQHRNSDYYHIIDFVRRHHQFLLGQFTEMELKQISLLWITVLGSLHKSLEFLIRLGADVNEQYGSPFGYTLSTNGLYLDQKSTVLHAMVELHGNTDNERRLIRLIMDRGADLRVRDVKGQTSLLCAARKEYVELAEVFLEKAGPSIVNIADNVGETPLLAAAKYMVPSDRMLQLMIRYGADIFAKDCFGHNALHYLPHADDVNHAATDIAKVLIAKGVSLHDRSRDHYQPLHHAVMSGKNNLVISYLDHGADVNALASKDITPLNLAALRRHNVQMLETLIKRGANINARTSSEGPFSGRTPLHEACGIFHEDNIKVLLYAGADVTIEDNDGNTPFALIRLRDTEGPCAMMMVMHLALQKGRQPEIELKDERIINSDEKLRNYYETCIAEIDRMKSTRFFHCCSFFELFTKERYQIAALLRNPDFELQFRLGMRKYEFSIYGESIDRAFDSARSYYSAMIELENMINEAVYNKLPHLIVQKVVRYVLMNVNFF